MKIKLTIIALILSCTIQAQDFFITNLWKFTYFSGIAAILSVPAYEHYWYELDKNSNGFIISTGVGNLSTAITINDYLDYASPPAEVTNAKNTLQTTKSTTVTLGQ